MKKYNITSLRKYQKDGQDKVAYPRIGTAYELKNGFRIVLDMFPNQDYFMFENEEKSAEKVMDGRDDKGFIESQKQAEMPPNNPPETQATTWTDENGNTNEIPF